jgi:hypothetical protein
MQENEFHVFGTKCVPLGSVGDGEFLDRPSDLSVLQDEVSLCEKY